MNRREYLNYGNLPKTETTQEVIQNFIQLSETDSRVDAIEHVSDSERDLYFEIRFGDGEQMSTIKPMQAVAQLLFEEPHERRARSEKHMQKIETARERLTREKNDILRQYPNAIFNDDDVFSKLPSDEVKLEYEWREAGRRPIKTDESHRLYKRSGQMICMFGFKASWCRAWHFDQTVPIKRRVKALGRGEEA